MITALFKNREFVFSGFNAEASVDDEMIYINGDKNDYQFAIELTGRTPKTYTKNDENSSISFTLPDGGDNFSAYNEDGMDETSLKIILTRCDSMIEGNFEAILAGEDSFEKITGTFSVPISN